MIQANELRIGNYVYDIDKDILQIGEILDIGVKFKNTSLASRYTKIQPIPLTEEILLKCGFCYDKYDGCFFLSHEKGISISHIIDGVTHYFGKEEYVWADVLNEIKYLHQLQNLYFALTGEELTVNL